MTNLQHVALFMFLIFLPMGRVLISILLLVSVLSSVPCILIILEQFPFMSTVKKLVKEPEFDDN